MAPVPARHPTPFCQQATAGVPHHREGVAPGDGEEIVGGVFTAEDSLGIGVQVLGENFHRLAALLVETAGELGPLFQ